MAHINKEHALSIAKKLDARVELRKNKRHDFALVYHNGDLVATFGIRRGSNKELGHDHIPHQILTTPHQARLLADCPWGKEDWLRLLGLLE